MPGDFQGGVFAIIVLAVFAVAVLFGPVIGIVLHVAGAAEARRTNEPRPSLLAFLAVGVLGSVGVVALGLAVTRRSSGSPAGNELLSALILGAVVSAVWVVAGALAHRRFRRWLLR